MTSTSVQSLITLTTLLARVTAGQWLIAFGSLTP